MLGYIVLFAAGHVKTQSNKEESTNIGAPLKNKHWTLVCLMLRYIVLFAAGYVPVVMA
jgi:hypothetical protein